MSFGAAILNTDEQLISMARKRHGIPDRRRATA
jgi:hypothetical protein